MAAPVYQATGTGAVGAGAVTPVWPAHQAGDIALLIVEAGASDTIALSTAAGFVEIPGSPLVGLSAVGTASTLAVFWCRATSSSMGDPTLAAVTDHQASQILTFRGCVGSGNPWDAIATDVNNVASTSVSAPAITTTVADTCIVSIISRGTDTIVAQFSAWGNSATERFDLGTNVGNGGGFGVADYVFAGPGTTTSTGATLNNTSATCAFTIALTAAATRAIVGTAALSLAPTGTLLGAASLAGSSALLFTPSGSLKGAGALAGSSAFALAPSASLSGTGTLVGANAVSFAASGSLLGAGALSGVSNVSLTPSGTLLGAGALTGASSFSLASAGVLLGAGVLNGATSITFDAIGTLDGTGGADPGAMVGAAGIVLSASGTLRGDAAMTAATTLALSSNGTLMGYALLTGATALSLDAAASLDATASLEGSASIEFNSEGSLLGDGALVGASDITFVCRLTLFSSSSQRPPLIAARPDSWSDGATVRPSSEELVTDRLTTTPPVAERP